MSAAATMTDHVDQYLAMKRALGYELTTAGESLRHFARIADRDVPGAPLTVDFALRWAWAGRTQERTGAARRLLILRPFARYLSTIQPQTEVPPKGILGPAQCRRTPHIYTDQQVRELLDAATGLRPCGGLRPRTVQTYLSLLACTGMRPSEPLKLTRDDVDFQSHTIRIQDTKFSKSRLVVVHPTATAALQAYARFRDRHVGQHRCPAFFLLDDGVPLTQKKALWAFRRLRRGLGWMTQPGQRAPRLYDLRHTFVCGRLLAWYREGVDINVAMPLLSTYLGHVRVTDTYWYVTGIPELLENVNSRFERFAFHEEGGQR